MPIRTTLAVTVAALALAACNQSSGPKTEAQVKAEVAGMVKPRPGQYETTVKVINFEIPGVPKEQSEKFKAMFASTGQSQGFCVTKEESEAGYKDFTKKLAQGNCTYDRFEASGGSLDAKLTCKTGQDMTAVIEMTGKMTEESSDMHMKMEQTGAGPLSAKGAVKMEMEMSSKRVGDCKG
ncbi:MAG: DUF3617 domain-containing protein [Novosphingobium sp.]